MVKYAIVRQAKKKRSPVRKTKSPLRKKAKSPARKKATPVKIKKLIKDIELMDLSGKVNEKVPAYVPQKKAPMRRTGGRMSARWYFDNFGHESALGDRCDIRGDGEYKCLVKRSNGSPFWLNDTENNRSRYRECENWSPRCKV